MFIKYGHSKTSQFNSNTKLPHLSEIFNIVVSCMEKLNNLNNSNIKINSKFVFDHLLLYDNLWNKNNIKHDFDQNIKLNKIKQAPFNFDKNNLHHR